MNKRNWLETTLGEMVTFQRGFDITKKEQRSGPYAVISSSGPKSTHCEFKVKGLGVVIGRKGSLGTVFFSKDDFWPHDTTLWVKDFHGNDEKFAYYFLQTMHLEQYDAGASNPSLNRNHIHLIPILYPPLPTQRKIAAILSAYDDLIENNTRRIALLEEMAQAIYREWFVHFRFPGHESVPLVESELGPIPEGWEVKQLGDLIELAYGKGLRKKDRVPGPYPVYGSSGVIDYHNEPLVEGPGIIVGRKGNVGSVFWSDEEFYPIDTVFYVKTDVNLRYVYYNLQRQNFLSTDTAVPGLSRNQAYLLPLLLPTKQAMRQFQSFIDPMLKQARNPRLKNTNLRRTRDLLLPRLISGQLDVSELAINGAPQE